MYTSDEYYWYFAPEIVFHHTLSKCIYKSRIEGRSFSVIFLQLFLLIFLCIKFTQAKNKIRKKKQVCNYERMQGQVEYLRRPNERSEAEGDVSLR